VYHLTADAEKAHYDLHENSPDDPAYRRFLGRLCDPMLARLQPGCSGLDFGAGPGPTLSVMFAEAGHEMAIFDKFYAPDEPVWTRQYDFISATEVVEHLHQPGQVLDRLWVALLPAGLLGIMTKQVRNRDAFASWHYKNDPTHICFFSRATFEWLAQQWGTHAEFIGADVVLFVKR
jgi:2-polyprenyl-3-methyl-5-hydroxy-6-metoxy-1,4-benzoquinol methylase